MSDAFKAFARAVQKSEIGDAFKNAPTVAVVSGPAVVIEAIVRVASENSGIPMDWGYVGGRGLVCSHGDLRKAREALFYAMPNSDLDLGDARA